MSLRGTFLEVLIVRNNDYQTHIEFRVPSKSQQSILSPIGQC